MASYQAPREWKEWVSCLTGGLQGRARWRLACVLPGVLFASGRRVVASWIQTAGVSDDFRDFYFFLQSVGRRWQDVGNRLLLLVLPLLKDQQRVLLAIDDSPTKRYGPHVQGAGIHHDPSPESLGILDSVLPAALAGHS
jgi:DDE superfamily endonuclease